MRLFKTMSFILLFIGVSFAKVKNFDNRAFLSSKDRPDQAKVDMTVAEAWTAIGNNGYMGGEFGNGWYGLSWPGGAVVNNYYLWGGYFIVGVKVGDEYYCTVNNYPFTNSEWAPSLGSDPAVYIGPGKSVYDVVVQYDDFNDQTNNAPGRHTGLQVTIRAMQWPHEPYNDFVVFEIFITYDKTKSDIPGAPDVLDSVFVGMWMDCDVSGADETNPHEDDIVMYEGWTNGEWDETKTPVSYNEVMKDDYIMYPDSSEPGQDGVPDYYIIWGDEPAEHIIEQDAWDITLSRPSGDTTIKGYIIPRGMSFIYDGDNPNTPENDVGEDGKSAGYIGGIWIYAPPSPADSIWIGPSGDTCRIIRPYSHQWWNIESDPATDEEQYQYLKGQHPATSPFRYAPNPYDLGASEYDYRYLSTVGPYSLASGDTLKFVYVLAVGQGLSGGMDNYWGRGWQRGLRHNVEWALKAYYTGDPSLSPEEIGDPIHPTPPVFDPAQDKYHWQIKVPPISPLLQYTAFPGKVILVWDNSPEKSPDPKKGYVDVVGYKVYRAAYQPSGWKLLAEFDLNNCPYRYEDTTAVPGVPYYYVVTAVDEDSLESPASNYKKDADGNPLAITVPTETGSLDDIVVVPNPYPGAAPWTATEIIDKIEFHNVPPSARIKIYTLSGDLVREIIHSSGKGTVAWDLLNSHGLKVASGVYIYKVETPDGKYKVGKFMILK